MNHQEVMDELAIDNMGLLTGLPTINPKLLARLREIVPERGDALWTRFTTWRDAQPDQGGDRPLNKWVGTLVMAAMLHQPLP